MKYEIDYSKTGLQQVLTLFKKKYGSIEKLVLYGDGSGKILDSSAVEIHDHSTTLFVFRSIDELLEHLEKK